MMKDFEYANKSLVRAAREKSGRRDHRLSPVDHQLCGLPKVVRDPGKEH